MNIDNITTGVSQVATQFIQQHFPDVPVEVIRFGGAALLAALALFMLIIAVRMLRSGKTTPLPPSASMFPARCNAKESFWTSPTRQRMKTSQFVAS